MGQWLEKTHAGKGSSSLSHHMWNLPQLPLHFSANLQRNKTSFLSIKNYVWPDLLRSGGAQGSGSFEILRGPGIRKMRDQEVPRDQDLLRSGGAQGLLWPLIRREVYGLEWPYIKRLKVIEKQMMQRNLPQCLKEYINSYSLLTIKLCKCLFLLSFKTVVSCKIWEIYQVKDLALFSEIIRQMWFLNTQLE